MLNPNSGEMSSDSPISPALPQLTAAPVESGSSEKASPTPKMEPISAWELELGKPYHQVPRFQMMAVSSRAKTIAMLWFRFWSTRLSTGSILMMPVATESPVTYTLPSTPRKLSVPLSTTATSGGSELV